MKIKIIFTAIVLSLNLPALHLQAATLIWDGSKYFKQADSPFYEGILAGSIAIDIGEGEGRRGLIIPYVSVPGIRVGGNFRSGVDEDDGVLDGLGRSNSFSAIFNFEMRPDGNGAYPRYLGAVMVTSMRGGINTLMVTATDGSTSYFEFTGPWWLETVGAGTINPGSYGMFWGIDEPKGILHAEFAGSDRLDHIQVGFVIPEPALGMWAVALGGLAGLVRRRKETDSSIG